MEIEKLNLEDIKKMDYNQIIGLVKETNRPPGGKESVFEIVNRLHLNERSKVLEIGTSTGFTSLEISRILNCEIMAIDINKDSLEEARARAKVEGYSNIEFQEADVNDLPFKDEQFDLVIIGNVFSLLKNKEKALDECMRVTKKGGFIASIPMYYVENPSEDLVNSVSEAIKVKITPMFKEDWINFFSIPELEIYWSKDFKFDYMEREIIEKFVEDILKREHLRKLRGEVYEELRNIYSNFMMLFRDNLSKMGYTIILLSKKKLWEDPELYTSKPIQWH